MSGRAMWAVLAVAVALLVPSPGEGQAVDTIRILIPRAIPDTVRLPPPPPETVLVRDTLRIRDTLVVRDTVLVPCECDTIPGPDPDPGPTPDPGWPQRPAGWRTLSGSTDFRNGADGGWRVKFADGSRPAPRTVAISDSPVGSTHEYRFDYPAGHRGGGGPEAYVNVSGNPQSVYVGLWIRYSQNWQGHPSCINKYLYLATQTSGWAATWYEVCGSGSQSLHSYLVDQTGGGWTDRREDVVFERGRWYQVEVIQTVGDPGRSQVWRDGVLIHDVRRRIGGTGIREATLSGIWGGVGGTVTQAMHWGVAAVEIAVP